MNITTVRKITDDCEWDKCNNSDGKRRICIDNQCVEYDELNDQGAIIDMEMEDMNETNWNETDIIYMICEITGMKPDEFVIGVQLDSNKSILHIIVVVNDDNIADVITAAMNECKDNDNDDKCNGIIRYVKSTKITKRSLSMGSHIDDLMIIIMEAFMIMVALN